MMISSLTCVILIWVTLLELEYNLFLNLSSIFFSSSIELNWAYVRHLGAKRMRWFLSFFYRFDSRYDGIYCEFWLIILFILHFVLSTYTALIFCMISFPPVFWEGGGQHCLFHSYKLWFNIFEISYWKVGIISSCLALKRFT